jgi:hypothetical protein
MAARKVNYCYVTVPNRAGKGAEVLREIKAAKVNLLAYSGFPASGGNSQLDMVASSITPIKRVAQQNGWKISKAKKGFLIQGPDKAGAVYRNIQKLADRGINVTRLVPTTSLSLIATPVASVGGTHRPPPGRLATSIAAVPARPVRWRELPLTPLQ